MQRILFSGLILTAICTGCQPKSPPPDTEMQKPMTIDASAVDAIRSDYQARNPSVRVGAIQVVLENSPYAAITGMMTDGLKVGDAIVLTDLDQNVLANSKVVRVMQERVDVQFEMKDAARRPQVGDVAFKF